MLCCDTKHYVANEFISEHEKFEDASSNVQFVSARIALSFFLQLVLVTCKTWFMLVWASIEVLLFVRTIGIIIDSILEDQYNLDV